MLKENQRARNRQRKKRMKINGKFRQFTKHAQSVDDDIKRYSAICEKEKKNRM